MQLKDLRWFCLAVDRGSLHAAADELAVTQPALSKAVRRLEAALGAQLLERMPRGVAPTGVGQLLYQRARALGNWVHDTEVLVQDLKTGQSGQLRVGVVPAMVESVLTPVLADFLSEGPGATFQTSVQLSGALLHELESGALDFAIAAMHPDRSPPALSCLPLGTQRSSIVARKEHPLFRRRFTIKDLGNEQWVLPPANITLRGWVDSMFRRAGVAATPGFVYTDATPAVFAQLVRRTSLLTVMADDSLRAAGSAGLAALGEPAPTWALKIGLFWRRNAYFSSLMERFRDRVHLAFAER